GAVVYNGIDESWFQPGKQINRTVRPYWIWWGMVSYRKNVDNLLKAYSQFLRKCNNDYLPDLVIITGSTQLPEEIDNLMQDPLLRNKVNRIPFQSLSSLQNYVNGSVGLLFPSRVEGFGMPAVEAMAMGKPVLTSAIPVMKEITNDLAIYCDPESVDSIIEGM